MRRFVVVAVGVIVGAGALTACEPPPRLEIVVNTSGDGADADPGDGICEVTPGAGDCTLRAAIQETNVEPSADIVTIAPGVAVSFGGSPEAITDSLDLRGGGTTLNDRLVHTDGALTVRDLTITGVTIAAGCGAGVTSTGTSLGLIDVVVAGNVSGGSGGGVCASGALALINTTVRDNQVTAGSASSGGGVEAAGDVVAIGSTIASNIVHSGTGSGLMVSGSGSVTLVNTTMAGNRSYYTQGSALAAPSATGRVQLSTVTDSVALSSDVTASGSVIGSCAPGGAPTSGGHNVWPASCGSGQGTDLAPGGVVVGDLGDAGGSTPTALPLASSPLLDAIAVGTPGLCDGSIPVDQRGLPRAVHGGCDIGAVELQTAVRAGPLVNLDDTAGQQGVVTAVNSDGFAVGSAWYGTEPFISFATRWSPTGVRSQLAVPGALASTADDINDAGEVVGSVSPSAGPMRAVRWDAAGVMVDLGTLPGDTSSRATALSGDGTVVGTSTGPGGTRTWWQAPAADTLTALPSLGGPNSSIAAVNDAGTAVGRSQRPDGSWAIVRWDLATGTVADLGTIPGGTEHVVADSNDAGIIVGTVTTPDLGDGCMEDFGFSCPDTRPFVWDPDDGELRLIELPSGSIGSAVAVTGDGMVLLQISRFAVQCSACENREHQLAVHDLGTAETVVLSAARDARSVDLADSGVVVANGLHSPGYPISWSNPRKLQLTW